jgi:hypothetical protein
MVLVLGAALTWIGNFISGEGIVHRLKGTTLDDMRQESACNPSAVGPMGPQGPSGISHIVIIDFLLIS